MTVRWVSLSCFPGSKILVSGPMLPLSQGVLESNGMKGASQHCDYLLQRRRYYRDSGALSWRHLTHSTYRSARRAGFDERDVLAALESKDLEEIQRFSGVKILPGHRKKILLHVARLRDEGGATQAGDQAGGPRGGWEVGGEGTKRGAEDTGGATERGEARATTEERRSGQEGGRRPEEMDRHENGEDAADRCVRGGQA